MNTLFPNEAKRPGIPAPAPHKGNIGFQLPIWDQIAQSLQSTLSQEDFNTWIKPVLAHQQSPQQIVLMLPNLVFYQTFHDDFLPVIDRQKNLLGYDFVEIHLDIAGHEPTKTLKELAPDYVQEDRELPNAPFSRSLNKLPSQIDPAYTFDTFVRGPSNQFAVASCQNVAENPGKTYNPLFIYGHTGLGKTHLMHAVGNRVLELNPNAVVTYVRSEYFMNEMIYCIRHNKTWDFRQKYRHCDVLLVDDIQFISGKKATQEEFFHTFNSLYETKKQIVITSDMFPQEIPDIEERLRNRFQWGLIADIQPPDIEHRMAILINKSESLGIALSEDVAEYISTHAKRNVRELEGALHRIHAFSTLHGRPIDMRLAAETFQNVLGDPPKRLTVDVIQKTVADHFKLKVTDLKSKRRHRALTLPRQVAMYLSRQLTKSSYPEIGEKFGGKDHTTVMHAVKKILAQKTQDLDLKAHLDALERQLEQLY
jgi:chromosomal replication initiator protein